ncbi:hypothetical protein D3C72_2505440 [compost metagenome]
MWSIALELIFKKQEHRAGSIYCTGDGINRNACLSVFTDTQQILGQGEIQSADH